MVFIQEKITRENQETLVTLVQTECIKNLSQLTGLEPAAQIP
jgi:hypothetical protein